MPIKPLILGGAQWGNNGYVWIGYNHFSSKVSEGYIAQDNSNTGGNSKEIEVSGNLNFGSIAVGQQLSKIFKIKNVGSEDLTVSSITVPNGYTLNWNSGGITPNNEINVTITFAPLSMVSYNGTISVNSNAQSGINSIAVTGNGGNTNILQFTDSRDSKVYNYVEIGNMVWMAENLNYDSPNSACYDNTNSYCNQYGRLYEFQEIMDAASLTNNIPSGVQGLCPTGWHLPSKNEWQELIDEYNDGNSNNGVAETYNALIQGGDSGFEGLLGGYNTWGTVSQDEGVRTMFWTTTEYTWGIPYGFYLSGFINFVGFSDASSSEMMYCRCVQN